MLTDEQAFLWRQRLRQERAIHNITDTHIRILDFTQGAIEAGDDQMSHTAVAEALGVADADLIHRWVLEKMSNS